MTGEGTTGEIAMTAGTTSGESAWKTMMHTEEEEEEEEEAAAVGGAAAANLSRRATDGDSIDNPTLMSAVPGAEEATVEGVRYR